MPISGLIVDAFGYSMDSSWQNYRTDLVNPHCDGFDLLKKINHKGVQAPSETPWIICKVCAIFPISVIFATNIRHRWVL